MGANPSSTAALAAVREILESAGGLWLTPYEIQRRVSATYGRWFSDSCITARIRDLRKNRHGARIVLRRARNAQTYEYHLLRKE